MTDDLSGDQGDDTKTQDCHKDSVCLSPDKDLFLDEQAAPHEFFCEVGAPRPCLLWVVRTPS